MSSTHSSTVTYSNQSSTTTGSVLVGNDNGLLHGRRAACFKRTPGICRRRFLQRHTLLQRACLCFAFGALTPSAGRQEVHLACKKLNDEVLQWSSIWSEVQMICMWSSRCHCHPVISCFIKIQIGLTFLVPAYPGCPGKEIVKQTSVYICAFVIINPRPTQPPTLSRMGNE